MKSAIKDGQVTTVGNGKMIHHCDDLPENEQVDMLVHDLDVIVKQLTELAGPTAAFQEIKAILSDLINLSQEEQIEKLTARNIQLQKDKDLLTERLINQ